MVPSNIVEGGFCCKSGDFIHGDDTMFIGDRDDPTADVSISMSTREMMYGSQGERVGAYGTHWLRCIRAMGWTAQEESGTTEDEVCGADVAVVPEGC